MKQMSGDSSMVSLRTRVCWHFACVILTVFLPLFFLGYLRKHYSEEGGAGQRDGYIF